MKGFLLFLLLFLAFNAQSQTFEMRLTNNGGGVIGVQMRETSGVGTPTTANFLTDLVFAICWDASYGINLTTITTNYTMTKAGPETISGAIEYQQFAKDPNPINFPTDWVQNDWVTIMTIPNNLAGAGSGNFSICPVNINELNINIDIVNDYAFANAGGANGVLLGFQALSATTTQGNVSCNGGSNGSIDVTVVGGTSPYTYNWGMGQPATEDRTGLAAGTYTVTVTDAVNATTTVSATITQPPALALGTTQVNVSCNGGSNGSIDLTVTGGTGSYSYNWGMGQPITQDRSGLAAGTYNVTVTDANNCTATTSATITQPAALALSTTQVNVACNGGTNGSIDLTVTGGTGSYTYNWGVGQPATQDRSDLAAGTYTVTVTDANNCPATTSATITQPAALALSTTQVNVACNGGTNGSIDLTVIGGTGSYTYNWGMGQPATQDRSDLAAGTYTVTVTDANNCAATTSATITQPTALALSTTQVNVACNGGTNGSIDLTVTGGTGSYTYNWGMGQPATQDRSGLAAGTYTVTVTDANNCPATTSATITQPAALALSTTQVNVACNGGTNGSIDLTVAGGTGSYTYNWGMGQPATQDRSGLAAGTYTVTVTDANNCAATTSATITQPAALALSTTQVNVACNGGTNGSIDLTVVGGTGSYTYNWGMGQPATQDRSGLAAATYTVTVTDANNCAATTSATITQPAALALSTTQVNVACNGASTGSIDLMVSGGTPGYTYNWGVGQPATQDRSGLAAGTYTVTVTDANNCAATTSATITQPAAALALGTTTTNATCGNANGAIDLTVTGGTQGYTYDWGAGQPATQDLTGLAADTYTVTVTDANNCTAVTTATIINANNPVLSTTKVDLLCNGAGNGSIDLTVTGGASPYTYNWGMGQPATQDRTGLGGGTYTVTVTDDNGCAVTTSETVIEPTALVLSTDITNADCNGPTGAIDLTVTGGTPGYTYDWADVAGNNNPQDRSNLGPATYTVTVTDDNNCAKSATATVVIDFSNQTPLTITCPPAGSIPTLNANSSCQAMIGDYTNLITITGGCGGALNPTLQVPAPGTIFNPGSVAVTLTISNNVGESSSCTVNVTISGSCGN